MPADSNPLGIRLEQLRDKAQILVCQDDGGSEDEWDRIILALGSLSQLVEGDARLTNQVAITMSRCVLFCDEAKNGSRA